MLTTRYPLGSVPVWSVPTEGHRGYPRPSPESAVGSHSESLDFGGFDASRCLFVRGEIPRPIGNFRELLTQRFLVYGFLVCELPIMLGKWRWVGPKHSHLWIHGRTLMSWAGREHVQVLAVSNHREDSMF